MLGKADLRFIQAASEKLTDGGRPMLELAAGPIGAVRDLAREIGRILAVHDENERLRAENDRLLAWKARAVRLEVQNKFLSEIVRLPTDEFLTRAVSARILSDSSPVFVQSRLLDVGSDDGVGEGMAVVDADGLVGRVLTVGQTTSQLLLLTDYSSRIPVLVGRTGEQAILNGDNSTLPILKFLPLNPAVRIGDEVITSGIGGIMPVGIPIGKLVENSDSGIRVQPYANWNRLNYVSVVQPTAALVGNDIVASGPTP